MIGKTPPPHSSSAVTDWTAIRRRLQEGEQILQEGAAPDATQTREILRTRAQILAQEDQPAQSGVAPIEVVEFLLAYEHYGIESVFVREIYQMRDLAPLPGTPAFVLGIVNVRGRILTVIDIKKFFNMPERGLTDLNKVIVVSGLGLEFGILADEVIGVRTIVRDTIQTTLSTVTDSRDHYLMGITAERMAILDMAALLADQRLIVDDDMPQ